MDTKERKTNLIKLFIFSIAFACFFMLTSKATFASSVNPENYFQNSKKNAKFNTGYYFIEIDGNLYEVPNIAETNKYGSVEKGEDEKNQIYTILPNLAAETNVNSSTGNSQKNSNEAESIQSAIKSLNSVQIYNQNFNLKNFDSINENYKKVFPQDEKTLDALFWVLNNVCNTVDTDSKAEILNKAEVDTKIFKTFKINAKTAEESEEDLIKIIQQAVIWSLAKGNAKDTPTIYVANTEDGEKINLNEAFQNYDNAIQKLYTYLLKNAQNAVKNGYSYNNQQGDLVSLEKNRSQIVEADENYIIGPYKITANSGFTDFDVKITDGENEVTNAKILDENKQEVTSGENALEKIKANLEKDFYISIPKNTSATKIRIELIAKFEKKNITYYSKSANEVNTSIPILKIQNERVNFLSYDVKNIIKTNFDLSLREFISTVNNKEPKDVRTCKISQQNFEKYVQGKSEIDNGTTIKKDCVKTPLSVNNGDVLNIVIRVYNEGQINGTASEITDYLLDGLEFVENSQVNEKYGWKKSEDNEKILKTEYLKDKNIAAFSSEKKNNAYFINYEDIQLELKVTANISTTDTVLKNITEITKVANLANENDRDSVPNNLANSEISNYSPGSSEGGKGYEDDDDFEVVNVVGKYFDLSLRLFASQVIAKSGNVVNYNREPKVDVSPLINGKKDAIYAGSKSPVGIENADSIVYTVRVYNESQIDGYADEVVVHLPEELEYVNDDFNANYGWIIDTTDETKRTLKTAYLSMEKDEDSPIKAFDENSNTLNYRDVLVKLKLKPTAETKKEITTIAEIIKSSNKFGISDRDNKLNVSMPSDNDLPKYKGNSENKDELSDSSYYYKGQEDDDDFEKIVFDKFDLALRVFQTALNGTAVKDRVPTVDASEFGVSSDGNLNTNCKYNQKKDTINVCENDKIEFKIRVYNEGTQNGYAKEIKNDIPDGLEFLPDDETNKQYKWKIYDSDGQETTEIDKCAYVKTTYLSKENEEGNSANMISFFDKAKMSSPAYKEIKIVLNIKLNDKNNREIVEKAQISDDSDADGNAILDIDSAPNEENEGEDDEDTEKLHILKFDLSLEQEVSEIITIENGIEKIKKIQSNEIQKNSENTQNNINENTAINQNDIVENLSNSRTQSLDFETNQNSAENTVTKFKFVITVANDGEIEGTASEISAYVPKDLIYNQADNLNWREKGSKIVTNALKEQTIKPRESAKVELILTLDSLDLSEKTISNVCEISEEQNSSNTLDFDSTPGNVKDDEDDLAKTEINIKINEKNNNYVILIVIGVVAVILAIGLIVTIRLLKK